MPSDNTKYVGRFAPSPTGPLHFGSIIAALASYLDARHNGGKWLLRMDDLDTPRVKTGADNKILYTLEALGMHWDGDILYQSQRHNAYREAEYFLESRDLLFPCYCSRRLVGGLPYPGTCRKAKLNTDRQHALRLKTESELCVLYDLIQPDYSQNLHEETGDFIIKRADGIYAYHLAVALDDAYQNITHVVRGADLMESTPRQIYLQKILGLPTPIYAHLPLAVSQSGQKISKQSGAEDVLLKNQPASILLSCLEFLGQGTETGLLQASVAEVIHWGTANWNLAKVPKLAAITVPEMFQITEA